MQKGVEHVSRSHADGSDCEFHRRLVTIPAQRSDLKSFVQDRALTRCQKVLKTSSVRFTVLRGNNRLDQEPPNCFHARPSETDLHPSAPIYTPCPVSNSPQYS